MSVYAVGLDNVGEMVLLNGNEAIARGAIEAGVSVMTCYPGSPTADVLPALAKWSEKYDIYTEYSTNEKVSAEVAAAASMTGLRSLAVCKPDGLNLMVDFLSSLTAAGIKGGMVVMCGDDPSGHSSLKEEDSRFLARTCNMPVIEAATPQDAKELLMTSYDLSEEFSIPILLRLTTRVCHVSENVTLGETPTEKRKPVLTTEDRYSTNVENVIACKSRLNELKEKFESFPYNTYDGPENAENLVIASGPSYKYAMETRRLLGLEKSVGILKLATIWPMPSNFILHYLKPAKTVLFAEEIDAVVEESVLTVAAGNISELNKIKFYGKNSGHVCNVNGPFMGELTPDILLSSMSEAFKAPYQKRTHKRLGEALSLIQNRLPNRDLALCAGCPHRASFFGIKKANEMDGRGTIVIGDIGCYTMGIHNTGYKLIQTVHCMGSCVGITSGLGKLNRFGFSQPVVAIIGDGTFYHGAMQGVFNAVYNQADLLLVILDNNMIAMTGHQPHPGTGLDPLGREIGKVELRSVLNGLNIPVTIQDPFDIDGTTSVMLRLLKETGPRVLILRRACTLSAVKGKEKPKVYVDKEKCLGDACGCGRLCSRVFACPANTWNSHEQKAMIDEALCNGCGVCATICPQNAIIVEGEVI